ncbi:MAG: hypothetical protein JRM89_03415 [Nitrososphaerota archaeon]|nr:hypothetical protein [Nitrososphaerota archaeon]WGO50974.1 MAG: hypothetical protein JRM93_02880 [Nitrososphaerota archaeon]
MKIQQRRRAAVSPIVATLLLIAISVALGVVVYVFTSGLAGSLTNAHVNQLTEQVSLDAYNFQVSPHNYLTMYLRNTGTGSVSVSAVYFNGVAAQFFGTCGYLVSTATTVTTATSSSTALAATTTTATETAQQTCQLNVFGMTASAGTSYQVTIATVDGGKFIFNVVAGQTG